MKMGYLFRYIVPLLLFSFVQCQLRRDARWCVVNDLEMAKCQALVDAINNRVRASSSYPEGYTGYDDLPMLMCVRANDHFACMEMIADNNADLVQLEPGMGYTAGEFYNMIPLMAEKYDTGSGDSGLNYYAVAVVRKESDIDFDNLAGKKSCHTGVGRAAGWVYPISKLIQEEKMPIVECNVPVKSAAGFFGPMCAANGLARYYNPFGNNPVSVCANCDDNIVTYCTTNDQYAGYDGAFKCMATGRGDVAFVRHTTIMQATANNSDWENDDFELVCPDGRRASFDQASTCNWGQIASHIVMTSTVIDANIRNEFKQLMKLISNDFGANGDHKDIFEVFKSTRFGRADLMFTDETKMLKDVAEVGNGLRTTYYSWVGEEHRNRLMILNTCPIQQARFCVISRYEMEKCENMIMAFAAKSLKPDLNCILGTGVRDCMEKIRMGDADLITLDAADVYIAGRYYNLVPIAAEDYSGYDAGTYYAVALARRTDSHLTLFNLKQRRSCHSMVMSAAGWVIPVDKLIETGQVHVHDCNAYFTVGQFFSKSCVPGVLHSSYNSKGTNPINLCEACAAGGNDRCMRNNNELYYGNSGAFRCLTERGGDVAFVKHTTARENTDGRNIAEWARNRRSDDYELLCNDGTRKDIDSWEDCNLGSVPSNAVVTANFKNNQTRAIFWTLLNFAQQFFASDSNEDFPMFKSMLDHKDLIFQDSTVRLIKVDQDDQNYKDYLGGDFLRAMERMESIDCITDNHAGRCSVSLSTLLALLFSVFILLSR